MLHISFAPNGLYLNTQLKSMSHCRDCSSTSQNWDADQLCIPVEGGKDNCVADFQIQCIHTIVLELVMLVSSPCLMNT